MGKLSCWLLAQWMLWKVRNWCKTCENLVHTASTIGELQYLKPAFLDTFKLGVKTGFPILGHIHCMNAASTVP